jgi:uncharacterized protein (DUF433 family)
LLLESPSTLNSAAAGRAFEECGFVSVDVLDLFAAGLSATQILEEMPDLESDDLAACLRFASRYVDHPPTTER